MNQKPSLRVSLSSSGNVLCAEDGARESFSIKINGNETDVGHCYSLVIWMIHRLSRKSGVTVDGLLRLAITSKMRKFLRPLTADEIVQSADVPKTPGWQQRVLDTLEAMVADGTVEVAPTIPISYTLSRSDSRGEEKAEEERQKA